MTKLARMVLMLLLVAGWAAAQSAAPASSADTGKKDSTATAEHKQMSCCCCQNMSHKHAEHKDTAKSEGKSEDGTMAGGMACCAKMGKDAAGGMKCGGGSESKSEAMP